MEKLNDFFLNTSLHGFKYLSGGDETLWRKLFRRIFWSFFIFLSIMLMGMILSSSLNEFKSKATSINLDVSYRDWNNTFPAISFCLVKGRSTVKIGEYMKRSWIELNISMPSRPIQHYRNVQNLLFMTFHRPLDGIEFDRCIDLNETCGIDFETIKRELFPKSCKEFMVSVKFLGREIKCDEIFKPQQTEIGDCFIANSLYLNGKTLENFDQLPLKFMNLEDVERSLEIHYIDNDLMTYKMFVHSPEEFPDAVSEGYTLRKTGSHTYMAFRMVEIFNQEGVKNESSENKQCRFPDEIITDNKMYQPPYSLSNCRANERIFRELTNCSCTLPIGDGSKYLPDGKSFCNIRQFKCIEEAFAKYVKMGDKRDDPCTMPTCLAMEIGLVGQVNTKIEGENKESVVIVDILNTPTVRYIRRVVVTKLDMLVHSVKVSLSANMRSIFFVVLILSIAIEISQGVIFDCNFNSDTNWIIIGQAYTCHSTVRASESGVILEDVRGSHLAAKSNNHVEFLYIFGQDLTFVPKEIEKFFPNLKGIYYHHSNLDTISSEDLKPFPQLVIFGVEYGNLVSLDRNLFQYNLNLQWIAFISNKIEHVGHNLLGGLSQLQTAYFSGNICVDQNAFTLETIKQLNQQLPILCPLIEVDECNDQLLLCINENEKANERNVELELENRVIKDQLLLSNIKISDLLLEIEKLAKSIEEANERNEKLEEENKVNNEKIIELEMLVRELLASTCS